MKTNQIYAMINSMSNEIIGAENITVKILPRLYHLDVWLCLLITTKIHATKRW